VSPPTSHPPAEVRRKSETTRDTQSLEPALPRIRKIKFFSQEQGIAVGAGTGNDPTGVFATDDGGKSWHSLPGRASPGWLGAAFISADAGILVGARGSRALAMEGKVVVPQRLERLSTRSLYDVALDVENGGWLVGDGGLVLCTENTGLVWQAPPEPLPQGIREAFDLRTVCCRGRRVWIGGEPGSVIWHTPDAGRSWVKQTTGQAQPVTRLFFASDSRGWGAGTLGTILRTEDGG